MMIVLGSEMLTETVGAVEINITFALALIVYSRRD